MVVRRVKSLLVAVFSVLTLSFPAAVLGQEENTNNDDQLLTEDHKGGADHDDEKSGKFDANKVIFGHVMDAHEFHFFSIGDFHATLPLPVMLYSPERGFTSFMSSKFHHGEDAYQGYRLVTQHYKENLKKEGMTDAEINLLSDEPGSKMLIISGAMQPIVKVDQLKGATKTPETVELNLADLIDVKGMKAMGNRLSAHVVQTVECRR